VRHQESEGALAVGQAGALRRRELIDAGGNQDAADRAADIALGAARQQGSNHVLLQALADFPAVVARRIDAEPHADSAWHGIGRALAAQGVAVGTRIPTTVELVEFGSTAIILNGTEARPSLAKCYELLGLLAARNGAPASRDELLNCLFDARTDESARSYLRKTVIGVRRMLPPDALSVSDGVVRGGGKSVSYAELIGGAGDFLLVPRGAAHTFGNQGPEPARLLVLHAPAMDAYFEELHKLWSAGKPPGQDAERELMSRYGMEPA